MKIIEKQHDKHKHQTEQQGTIVRSQLPQQNNDKTTL